MSEHVNLSEEERDKRDKIELRDKESAARWRQRRLDLVGSLQSQVDQLHDDNKAKDSKIAELMSLKNSLLAVVLERQCVLPEALRQLLDLDTSSTQQHMPRGGILQDIPPPFPPRKRPASEMVPDLRPPPSQPSHTMPPASTTTAHSIVVDGRVRELERGLHELRSAKDDCELQLGEMTHKLDTAQRDVVRLLAALNAHLVGAGDSIREKCLAECKGMELELCRFESSSRLVEKLFAGCREGACRWLVAFGKLKRARQLDALCRGCSCHCLETLLFALSPRLDAEVIDELCDVIVECWKDVVMSINASHFVCSFVRVLLGLPKLERVKGGASGVDVFPAEWLANSGAQLKKNARNFTGNVHLKRTFEKVVNLALDYTSMKDLMEADSVCLLMQEMVEYDWFANTGRASQMVTRSLEHPEDVLTQCTAQKSSRVWQALVKRISEDERQSLYHAAFNGNLFLLSSDRFANYVVQSFISNAKSDELVMDVFHEMLVVVDQLCDRNIWNVVKGLIQCSANHFISQKLFITQLRTHFLSTKTNKQAFVPNVFTLNNAQIETDANGMLDFAVGNGSIPGSFMLQELFRLKHNKSAVASMLSLSENTIQSLALHQGGSYVLEAFFKSAEVKHKDKDKVAAILKKKWMDLLEDPIASHVFDVLWDSGLFTMDEKRKVMTDLCYSESQERSHSKEGQEMLYVLDARGFREDPQHWTAAERNRMMTLAGTVM